ncbi:low temperature requirement protein A [Microbacterium sp. ASV49]|uniref:Low temperature requirement protein A n=1 Tax=Microbacterium candidum TaxID=3041922 RepID=A0ABT7N325_9MICO|nr:low temperature requirement protein A [Microbacterium sp. ASV49]MDL9981117.1 low temperature requirement protein A [Microbacterium sp. ASV49]
MSLSHSLGRMTGRDPHEAHRASTPLELLFDLTFVVAFSQVSAQTAQYLEAGHVRTAIIAFVFTVFAAMLPWVNYSWLASAYDNDDIFFRIATLVEMIGVLILALGVPAVFVSIDAGKVLDNHVLVAGYVIMRVAAIALWLRAAKHDPTHRATALAYAKYIALAQVFWVAIVIVDLPLWPTIAILLIGVLIELLGPKYAERKTNGTPWNPHHIAERYGLLVIITLGEVVLGTILAISAGVQEFGWSLEAALLAFGGTALVFGLWWTYFLTPFADLLALPRPRPFSFGYLHFFVFASVVAVGAGLHVAAQAIAHHGDVAPVFAMWTVAIPVLVFEFALFLIYSLMSREVDPFHFWMFAGCAVMLAIAVVAVQLGASLGVGLVLVAGSPAVIVVGYEAGGWRHIPAMLERARAR